MKRGNHLFCVRLKQKSFTLMLCHMPWSYFLDIGNQCPYFILTWWCGITWGISATTLFQPRPPQASHMASHRGLTNHQPPLCEDRQNHRAHRILSLFSSAPAFFVSSTLPKGNQISRNIKDKSEPFRIKLLQNRHFATHFSWVSELKQPDWRKGLPCLDEWLRQRGPMLCATETKNPCCALTVKLQMDDTQAFQMDMEKGLQVLHD